MFGFVDRLAVELEDKRRMAGFQNVGVHILVTGDAGVRAHIKISQIVHTRAHARRVSPIGARVAAQPRFGRTVTTLARNAFVRMRGRLEATLRYGLKRRMADGAARARLRFVNSNRLCDSRRTRVEQNRVSAGVIILLRPGNVLASFFARTAMTTRRFAADRADKLCVAVARLLHLCGNSENGGKKNDNRNRSKHVRQINIAEANNSTLNGL